MRILLASGGSLHSETALWLGAQLAARSDEPATVMTVMPNAASQPMAKGILERASNILESAGVSTNTVVRVGRRDVQILEEASSGYDLLVLGERQLHDLRTRLLGSITERIIKQSPCPVLIAKGDVEPLNNVLLCDSGGGSRPVVKRFVESGFCKLLPDDAETVVVHVMSQISAGPGIRGVQLRATAEELISMHSPEGKLLERDLRYLDSCTVKRRAVVRHGLVLDEILAESQSGAYRLVVIGAHREAGWERFLLDDIAHQVIVQIDRPVLIMP
ncbi:MAG: universal stress protein [Caldilineales bacterium]|nr:universal stress protein [Caldilineales bacterium]